MKQEEVSIYTFFQKSIFSYYFISSLQESCPLGYVNPGLDLDWPLSCLTTVTVDMFQTKGMGQWEIGPTILALMQSRFSFCICCAVYTINLVRDT